MKIDWRGALTLFCLLAVFGLGVVKLVQLVF